MSNVRGPLLSDMPPTPTVVAAVYNATPPAPADQQGVALQADSEGNLLVNVAAGTIVASNPSVGVNGVAAPADSTKIGFIDGTGKLQGVSATNPLPVNVTTIVADTVKIEGNTGVPLDVALGAAKPANVLQVGGNDGTNAYAIPLASGGTSAVVSGTVTTTPPTNASTNVAQLAGTTTDTNSGNKSNGTLRVVIATDQPNLTTALNVHDASPSALATGSNTIGKVDILGNAGAILDAAQGGTPSANAIQISDIAATSLPAATTNAKTVVPMADKFGRAAVVLQGDRALITAFTYQSTAASPATMITSGGVGVYTDICELILTNESSTATIVSISDGTLTYKFALAANGGLTKTFAVPLPASSTATAWTVSNSAAVNVDCVGIVINNK